MSAISKPALRPSRRRVLALLTEPKSAPALREALGISRQGVDQLLKGMLKAGLIHRFEVEKERGSFLYADKQRHRKGLPRKITPELHASRARLLSMLSPDTLSRPRDFKSTLNAVATTRALNRLIALELIVMFTLGRERFVGITPKGLRHPQYDSKGPKAPAADIVADFGKTRVSYIQFLQVLGTAKARELTALMPKGHFENQTWKSGQVIQRLQIENLIEKVDNSERSHVDYRLSEKGQFIAAILSRTLPIPPAEVRRQIVRIRGRNRAR